MYILALEADQHRPDHAGENGDIVQFTDDAADAQPRGHGAGVQVKDGKAAASLGVPCAKRGVEREPREGAVVARQ